MKRAKKGVKQLEVLHELKLLALEMFQPLLQLMPPSETAVGPQHTPVLTQMEQVVHIPMDCATYNTEGLCLTGPVQLKWMEQLLEHPREFVLHVDGKHKLHHGGWVLMTIGFHILRWDEHHHTLSTKFLPLVYQMCKQVGHAAGQDTRNRMYSACIPHVSRAFCPCAHRWSRARRRSLARLTCLWMPSTLCASRSLASASSQVQGSRTTATPTGTGLHAHSRTRRSRSAGRTLHGSCARAITARRRGCTSRRSRRTHVPFILPCPLR